MCSTGAHRGNAGHLYRHESWPVPVLQQGCFFPPKKKIPLPVQEEIGTQVLLFRRSTAPAEKDKQQRLADAAESLQACPDVVWYNATFGSANAAPLHVMPGTLAVAWSISRHDVATHMRIIPALLRWTRWDREASWQQLRTEMAVESQSTMRVPSHPRHVRIAQVVDFIGMQAMTMGQSDNDVMVVCQKVLQMHAAGHVQTDWDAETGEVKDVTFNV